MGHCNYTHLTFLCFCISFSLIATSNLNIVRLDRRSVCNIKLTCLDCLRLSHCSWCPTEKKCFSEQLPNFEGYCETEKIRYPNHEMSFEDNAVCACAGSELESNCRPPGSTGPDCSGRGTCTCGRCFCDKTPDPEHPTKAIMGEHCEYDNFSCDNPKCNEGPYSIYEIMTNEKNTEVEE